VGQTDRQTDRQKAGSQRCFKISYRITSYRRKQVCVELSTAARNMAVLAFAAECRAAVDVDRKGVSY